ncbi:MAG: hypothetical protein LBC73_07830 [Oscillospiraceae bacterium]|jgi:Na+-driven multidrug efflux pump/anti-sigma regulatory factor (Ser/Thr protein kinase)|nr:hypothetical protein [Oscillospiraceae bacterium]
MNLYEDNSGLVKKVFLKNAVYSVSALSVAHVAPIVCGAVAGLVLGEVGLAVVGIFAPFFFLTGFFGTVIASGAASTAAKYIAADDDNRVYELYTLSIILTTLCATTLFILSMIFRETILSVIAGSGELYRYASLLFLPIILANCIIITIYVPMYWARLIGRTPVVLIFNTIQSIMSVVLVLLFIYVLNMGIIALAISQLISAVVSTILGFIMIHTTKNRMKLRIPRNFGKDLLPVLSIGSPPAFVRLFRFAAMFVINIILLNFVGVAAIAIFSILNMLQRFVIALANGISGVQIPISSILHEERDIISLRQLSREMFRFCSIFMIIATILLLVFNRFVAGIFGVTDSILFALVCFCIYSFIYVISSLFISWYTAFRFIKLANILVLCQDLILPLISVTIFAILFVDVFWLYMPIGMALILIILPLILMFVRKKNKNLSFPLLLDTTETKDAVLSFSVARDSNEAGKASAAVETFCNQQKMDKKKTLLLALAIEEMIILITKNNEQGGDVSVRLALFEENIVLRLRNSGKRFNPIEYYKQRLETAENIDESVEVLGIKYITESAKKVYYKETFGINSLVVALKT